VSESSRAYLDYRKEPSQHLIPKSFQRSNYVLQEFNTTNASRIEKRREIPCINTAFDELPSTQPSSTHVHAPDWAHHSPHNYTSHTSHSVSHFFSLLSPLPPTPLHVPHPLPIYGVHRHLRASLAAVHAPNLRAWTNQPAPSESGTQPQRGAVQPDPLQRAHVVLSASAKTCCPDVQRCVVTGTGQAVRATRRRGAGPGCRVGLVADYAGCSRVGRWGGWDI
jgi:hypothetical protein